MQSLQTLMRQLERTPGWQAAAPLRQLVALWPRLVGAAVAQHSAPNRIQRGVLYVSVSSAAWAQTLTFERPRILAKIHEQIPVMVSDVQEIRFSTARWHQNAQRSRSLTPFQQTQHPSWIQPVSRLSQPLPKTAETAFRAWSHHMRAQLATQSSCPKCKRPCPTQELERWTVCSICMTHYWQTNLREGL